LIEGLRDPSCLACKPISPFPAKGKKDVWHGELGDQLMFKQEVSGRLAIYSYSDGDMKGVKKEL
jgi:hypothetical protein